MALTLRSLLLLGGLIGMMTGVRAFPTKHLKDVSCPEGWTQLDCKCYIYQDEERDFADAEAVCNILGGNLVSITSDLENAVIRELVTAGIGIASGAGAGVFSPIWIGYHDGVETGNFMWTDGEISSYENFVSPPPGISTCAGILPTTNGEWVHVSCFSISTYVCSMEAGH
ncbi:snaclec 3-like [Stigmatopora argus]